MEPSWSLTLEIIASSSSKRKETTFFCILSLPLPFFFFFFCSFSDEGNGGERMDRQKGGELKDDWEHAEKKGN